MQKKYAESNRYRVQMRLASIHTYPIKGCGRLDHNGSAVELWGLAGDVGDEATIIG